MRRDLATQVRTVQFRVGIGAVPIAGSTRTEHHVTSIHRALVHFTQMNGREMDLQRSFVAECLEANVALDPFLASGRIDQLSAQRS